MRFEEGELEGLVAALEAPGEPLFRGDLSPIAEPDAMQ
jgi:hypothetical protein